MAPRPPPELPDEIVEEILLHVPPDDPARLVCAALACKRWCRLVSGPGFRRRFRELHPTPPVLGFLRNHDCAVTARFVPAAAWSLRRPRAGRRGWRVLESRNSHVLLRSEMSRKRHFSVNALAFAVWDPVTDEMRELPAPPMPEFAYYYTFDAAVFCAAATAGYCGHLDCRREPFLVVFVGALSASTFACVYTSEADAWSEPTFALHQHRYGFFFEAGSSAHVGNEVYFKIRVETGNRILKFDFGSQEMTVIDPPPMSNHCISVLKTTEGGGLGCITLKDSKLNLWSRELGPNGVMGWQQCNAIEIKTLVLDGNKLLSFAVVSLAVADGGGGGGGLVYVETVDGSYITDLESGHSRKVEGINGVGDVIPYISFCIPALGMASTGEDPRVDA